MTATEILNNTSEQYPELTPYLYVINTADVEAAFRNQHHSCEAIAARTCVDFAKRVISFKNQLDSAVANAKANGAQMLDIDYSTAIDAEVRAFVIELKALFTTYINKESQCASPMVTGPANFPVERNRKRRAAAMAASDNIHERSEKIAKRVIKTLLPSGDGSQIKTVSDTAADALSAKIQAKIEHQERMKGINATVRTFFPKGLPVGDTDIATKNATQVLQAKFSLSLSECEQLLKPKYGRVIPFESFTLTNNSAEIRRLTKRLKSQERLDARREDPKCLCGELSNGICYSMTNDNRIAIHFKQKPDAHVRKFLSKYSFRFSHSRSNAWVRPHTHNAEYDFKNFIVPFLDQLN